MNGAKKTIGYAFDAVGNRSRMTDPDGGRFTYAYDAAQRITHLVNPEADRTTFSYDAADRRTLTKLANGTRASFSYDDANRLTRLANLKSDGATISSFDYQYDSANRRTVSLENDGSRVTWTYDNSSQLLADHRTGTAAYRNTFSYDPNGNRLLKNESGIRTTYSYDAADQLITGIDPTGTTTYSFDADGNQQLVIEPTGDRTTTTWDYENRTSLILLPDSTRNTMLYNPDGLRIQLADSTGEKNFIWDNENYLAELDNSNLATALYTNEPQQYGNLISQRRGTTTKWYHYEALGSTRELTDASETVTDTYLYDAWGNILTSTGTTVNPFRYVGQLGYYFDPDTGRYYIRARIYDPVSGRWMSVDPIGFVDGLNLYVAYFVPLTHDPEGTISDDDLIFKNEHPRLPPPVLCGNLTVRCPFHGWLIRMTVPVYGRSDLPVLLMGTNGCVTLPGKIMCSGSCKAIKTWKSAGNPKVDILDHEACHWCAFQTGGFWKYVRTCGPAPDACVGNEVPSTPGW